MAKRKLTSGKKTVKRTRIIIIGMGEMKGALFTRAQATAAVTALDKKKKIN
jgi:hypothetical protein